jgi:hypothetical protein
MSNKRWSISKINGLQWVLSFFPGGLILVQNIEGVDDTGGQRFKEAGG